MTAISRMLVCASTFPRWQGDQVPDFVAQQLRELHKLHPQLEITILAPHHQGAKRKENLGFAKIHRYHYLLPEAWQQLAYPAILPNLKQRPWLYLQVPLLMLCQFFALYRLVKRTRPDVIYSHWFVPQGVIGGLVGWLTQTPHCYTSHSSDVAIAAKLPFLGSWLVRALSYKAHAISTVSRRTQTKLQAFFTPAQWRQLAPKVEIIPMGVRPQPQTTLGNNTVLFIGRLVEKKGIRFLIEGFASALPQLGDCTLVIAGDGPLLPELKAQAAPLGKRVEFCGYLNQQQKWAQLNQCRVFVQPSIIAADGDAEGLPVALMEAMSLGKACIATKVSGADELIQHNQNGLLIDDADAKAIADALRQLWHQPSAQTLAMQAAAKLSSQAVQWPTVAQRHWEHLFDGD